MNPNIISGVFPATLTPPSATTPDPTLQAAPKPADPSNTPPPDTSHSTSSPSQAAAAQAAGYRLVIQVNPEDGQYIYKSVDPATGAVVNAFPRAEILKMQEAGLYSSGAVVDQSA